MIRGLHISDLHSNDDNMSTSMLRKELPLFLSRKRLRCDYIFCTGDIREGKAGVFLNDAADYLKKLCEAVGADISQLFIVPENHDIDRKSCGRNEAIEHIKFQRRGSYEPVYGTIAENDLKAIHAGQKDFRAFLATVFDSNRLSYYENPLAPHFNVETPEFNILHVDTMLTFREGQEATDLVIGTKPLLDALDTLNQDKPTILLTHYPFTSLLQDEKRYVSELLYRHGVRLWLAGHEHDHNLMPLKYLYSVQAGVMRMEEKTHATVLNGNYDPDTCHGYISAYTWFPEGWAEYPIIWHEYAEENKFPFALRLPRDNGLSREAVLIQRANHEYVGRLPENVIDSIFPDFQIEREHYPSNLANRMEPMWKSAKPNLILLADGGMGKSTIFLDMCRKAENSLYISLEGLFSIGYGIEEYCAHVLFDGSADRLRDFARSKYSELSLILLIDGMNEVDGDAERRFINEIKRLNLLKGIQVAISSRSDFTPRYSMAGYRVAELLPLSDEKIQSVFTETDWAEIKSTPTLHHLLSNPMMVTMYKEVNPIIDQYSDVEFLKWSIPIKNATDLLHNYYVTQIAVLLNRDGATAQKAARCVFDILPYVAYTLESNHRFTLLNKDLRELVKFDIQPFDSEEIDAICEYFRCGKVSNDVDAVDILTNVLHLIHKGREFSSFPHQIYRDYLSAYWIVNETARTADVDDIWNKRGIPHYVMEHIRNLSGQYWNGIVEKVHEAGKGRDDVFHLVGNLLDCFTYTDKSGVPDYSGLNLCGLQLPDYHVSGDRILLDAAKIDSDTIGKCRARPVKYTKLSFSEDNAYLAAANGKQVTIFPLQTDEEIFRYSIGAEASTLEFAGDYLFAVVGNSKIVIFKRTDTWSYTGKYHRPMIRRYSIDG